MDSCEPILSGKDREDAWEMFFDDWKKDYEKEHKIEHFQNENCYLIDRYYNFSASWIGFQEGYKKGMEEEDE